MAQDPIANYVVKKAIETAPEGEIKQELLEILSRNRDELVSVPNVKLSKQLHHWRVFLTMSVIVNFYQLKSPYAKYIVRTP